MASISWSFHMMVLFLVIFGLGFQGEILGQNSKIDSLDRLLKTEYLQSDSLRFEAMLSLCWELNISDPMSIGKYENELLTLEKKNSKSKTDPRVQIVLGYYYKKLGNNDIAFDRFNAALKYYESNKDTLNIIRSLYRLGELSNSTHNLDKNHVSVLEYYTDALDYLKYYNNPEQLIFIQNGIAVVHANNAAYGEALKYLDKSQTVYDTFDFPNKNRSLGFFYYHKARAYYYLDKLDQVKPLLDKAETIALELNYLDLQIEVYYYFGCYYQKIGNLASAENYFLKNVEIQKDFGLDHHFKSMEELLLFYQKSNLPKKAFNILGTYLVLKDSFYLKYNKNAYAELETKFKVEQKELEIKLLQSENDATGNKLLIRNILLWASVILLAFILFLLYWKRKQTALLEQSNAYKDKLLNIMGHDIRTPLVTQIALMSQFLNDDKKFMDKSFRTRLYNISLSVFKVSQNIQIWAQQSKSLANDHDKKINILHELELVLEQYQPIIQLHELNFVKNYNFEGEVNIIANRMAIQAVFRNIIDNCVKYAKKVSDVFVDVSVSENNKLIITVTNEIQDDVPKSGNVQLDGGMGINIITSIVQESEGKIACGRYTRDKFRCTLEFNIVN